MSGGARVKATVAVAAIPAATKKLMHGVKEIVNCTEAEIYAMLKECEMDLDEAISRLLAQDTFHEVKSKREMKKEAEAWVNNMSGSTDSTLGELAEVEYEGRIPRLGLGAKVPENARSLTDPVERKLLGKFNACARQFSKSTGKASADEECEPNEDDNDDEPESKAKSFVKK